MENPNKDNFSQGKKESKCINKQIRLLYVITGVFVPVIPLLLALTKDALCQQNITT